MPRDNTHAATRSQAARQQRQRPSRAGARGDARQGGPRAYAPGGRARGPGRRRPRALGQPPRALRFRQRVLCSRPDQAWRSQPDKAWRSRVRFHSGSSGAAGASQARCCRPGRPSLQYAQSSCPAAGKSYSGVQLPLIRKAEQQADACPGDKGWG